MFSLLALMLVGAVFVSLGLLRLRQSLLVGYFLCGLAIANFGLLDVIAGEGAHGAIATMSEVGIMLLLFTIGMEFSLAELKNLRSYAFIGGGLQVALTLGAAGVTAAVFFNLGWQQALVVAVACALSSTAISVKLYHDMGVSASTGARFALGIAIFQDLCVIAFLVLLPALFHAGGGDVSLAEALLATAGKGCAFIAVAVFLARFLIPRVLLAVARSRSRELFTITVAGVCIGVAFLAAMMGLSLALGAFVAGLAVSECIFKHRILSEVAPLKDLFLTIFFISVGLGVDLTAVMAHWPLVLGVCAGLIVFKAALVTAIGRWLRLSWRAAVTAGIGLCSAGEFSLVLLSKTASMTDWPGGLSQALIAAMAVSMASVPALMSFSGPLAEFLDRRFPERRPHLAPDARPSLKVRALTGHAVICGYGPVGRTLSAALDAEGVPVLVIDLNADTIHSLLDAGTPALFADARQPEVWDLAGLAAARLVAFTFPATPEIATAIGCVRERNPAIPVLARAKFSREAAAIRNAGADIVILDEEECSRAVVEGALRVFNLSPPEAIEWRADEPAG